MQKHVDVNADGIINEMDSHPEEKGFASPGAKKAQQLAPEGDYSDIESQIIDKETGDYRPAVLNVDGSFLRWKTDDEIAIDKEDEAEWLKEEGIEHTQEYEDWLQSEDE